MGTSDFTQQCYVMFLCQHVTRDLVFNLNALNVVYFSPCHANKPSVKLKFGPC